MRKTIVFLLALGSALCGASSGVGADVCSSVSGNLVANCGFETGTFSGWTPAGNLDPVLSDQGVDSLDAWSGAYGAYIHAVAAPTTLSQSVSTAIGNKYTVTFWLANGAPADPSAGYLNSVDVSFGLGKYVATNQDIFGYSAYSFLGEAYGSSSKLIFSLQNDAGYFSLDSVSVVLASVAPEPATGLLLLPTAGLLLYWRRRVSR